MYDTDIDRQMRRTMARPVPRGAIAREARAGVRGGARQRARSCCSYYLVNPLAAWLSLAGNAYYVSCTRCGSSAAPRRTSSIGGAAGSVPPLVGWAAVTGTLGAPAVALVVLIFLWTPPHFWALALMTETDYDKAGIPMLPNVHGVLRTKREMLAYTIVLFVFCVALVAAARHGADFPGRDAGLGRLVHLRRRARAARRRRQRFARAHVQVFAALSRADVRLAVVVDRVVALTGCAVTGRRPRQPRRTCDALAGHRLDPSTIPLLVTLGLGVFAGALDLGVLSPALPALGYRIRRRARASLPWVFTLYLLANVVSIPIMTKLADRNGRRPVYIAVRRDLRARIGARDRVARASRCSLTARAIQAFGAGGIFPVATAAIADRVPPERRGAALGLVAATWGVAAIIGPLVGGSSRTSCRGTGSSSPTFRSRWS